ncbi:MAG: CsgG/HfaB family protein [Desulfobulbales bacterium]|nr:CsgG/HfaB family protein [Desulfobulbales bacterium]
MNFPRKVASRVVLILAALAMVSCSSGYTGKPAALKQLEPFAAEDRYVIAVMPFEFKGEQAEYRHSGDKLMDMAMIELFKTKRFRIVERSRISAVLNEIQLGQAGITAGDMADRIGKQLGAEMVMIGAIASIRSIKSKDTVGIAHMNTSGFEVGLNGRLVNIAKGELVAVGQASAVEQQTVKVAMGAQTGSIDPEETILDKAFEKALRELVNDLAANIPPKSGA